MFLAAMIKEFKLVFRDLHSVLVLFAMPSVFIIIMSLALQEQFTEDKDFSFTIYYSNAEKSEYSGQFLASLSKHHFFNFEETKVVNNPADIIEILGDKSKAFLSIPTNLFDHFQSDLEDVEPIKLWFSPSINVQTRLLLESAIYEALAKTKLHFMFTPQLSTADKAKDFIAVESLQTTYLYAQKTPGKSPTAVQQNVPAWLIFSMFFVVIPISTTLITEKQQGTLTRLRTMNTSMGLFFVAKTLPYLVINQVQLITMLLLGAYIVPLLGGDSLVIGHHYFALAFMSLAIGIAAIGYALLVAVVAKTTEQATSIGGVGNILLGAIGGIMVPKFIMPEYLQAFTYVSPMSWGLDGFLDIFLYGNDIIAILPEVMMLLAFGGAMLVLALAIFHRQS
ncbi:MAG: ABC transporter permease [Gammaproteobacteria bacterium]|nr:ABC transporter permease [Gammaproteobacteria bacterium]